MSRYIDAESLLTKIKAYRPYMYLGEDALSYAIKMVELEPSADVRENVRATLRDDHGNYRCTNCNALISDEIDYVLEDYKPIQFCPNCGAQMMRGEQE